jgi:glycosyltransferase involved in cell wall biosynthesis
MPVRSRVRRQPRRKLMYVQYTNPAAYPPLEHSSRIAAADGWDVLFVGVDVLGAESLRFPPHERIGVRRLAAIPAGGRQWLRYIYFALWVLRCALVWRPSRVYASEYLACPIGLGLSFVPGLKVIYHEHDSPAAAGHDAARRMCLAARSWLARRAAVCVLPNERRAGRFAREVRTQREVVSVWNCPSRAEIGPPHAMGDQQSLYVLYHGSIVPSRLPTAVVMALARLPESVNLRVIGYETVGHEGYLRTLRATAQQLGVDRRIEFLGTLPTRADVLRWARQSDVGLSLFTPGVSAGADDQAMVGASNKPFDCLASGLPLLVPDLEDWRRLYVAPGYGLACDPEDPESIAAALEWLLTHPHERWQMGERGRQRVLDDWNYERQFARVYAALCAG